MTRIERFYDACGLIRVAEAVEEAQEAEREHRRKAIEAANEKRAIPAAPVIKLPRFDDPVEEHPLDEADLEYFHLKTSKWDDDAGPDATSWQILLPALREIDRAWEEAQSLRSKSNGSGKEVEKKAEAENAMAT